MRGGADLPGLQLLLELCLHGFAGLGSSHLLIGNNILELKIILDDIAGGHQVVVVDVLDEGLHSALSIELLLAHASGNLAGGTLNTDDEGVAELSVLNATKNRVISALNKHLPSCLHRSA